MAKFGLTLHPDQDPVASATADPTGHGGRHYRNLRLPRLHAPLAAKSSEAVGPGLRTRKAGLGGLAGLTAGAAAIGTGR